ncbi:MAG TPA: pyridoxamine 5'-phosphate oxidase [Thermomicrobiales bacterium]|nr:pyridoxamine 5'-phosphate oxidase [Thermomicrobiales bacterium]
MTDSLPGMRKTYTLGALENGGAPDVPSALFREWLEQARDSGAIEANAMIVSTVGEDGVPSSRTVLLKGADEVGLVFYTNYDSQKGREIARNPAVALLFYWPAHERQVRITGTASRISGEESDAYFQSRPIGNRIGAVISPQSTVIPDRAWLEQRKAEAEAVARGEGEEAISRPPNWGGYRVSPRIYEFWQGRPDRIHDRLRYRLENDRWILERLAP